MTLGKEPICTACKRLRRTIDGPTCSAFPDGIPDRIWLGGFDHRQPFPGDGGQRFVRNPDEPLPPAFPEEAEVRQPIRLVDPGEIRTQTRAELRDTAKRLIADLRHQSREDGAF